MIFSRSSIGALGVVEEGGLVEPALVAAPCRRTPPSPACGRGRSAWPGSAREAVGLGDRDRRVARVQVHRVRVELQLAVGPHHVELRHAVQLDQEVDLEGERDPVAPLAGLQREASGPGSRCRPGPSPRSSCTVIGRSMSLPVASSLQPRLLLVGERPRLLLLACSSRSSCFRIGFSGPFSNVCGHAALEEQPLQEAAELGVALLERARGRWPSSRRCRACRGCRAGAGPPSISPWAISSGGNVMGTVSTSLFTPSRPACTQNDVPPRVEVILGGLVGIRPHRNSRRLLLHHRRGRACRSSKSRTRKS